MGRRASEKYYEIWVDRSYEKTYKTLESANLSAGQFAVQGHFVKIIAFDKGEERDFTNVITSKSGNYAINHDEYGTLSKISVMSNGSTVYSWHQQGDKRGIKIFGDNMSAMAMARKLHGRVKLLGS